MITDFIWIIQLSDYILASYDKDLIRLSMEEIELNICIKFVPRTSENDFIHIWSGGDCSSAVGRQGGQQLVSLTTNSGK